MSDIPPGEDFVDLTVGLALKSDGSLVAWGKSDKGSSLLLSSFVDDEERTRVEQYLTSFETVLYPDSSVPTL